MRKLKLYSLLVVGLLVIILLLNMKEIKKYALPVALAILGFLAGWFLKPKTTIHKSICETEIVYKDTCLTNSLLCTITSKDSISIYRIIREGLKSKSEKVVPQVEKEVVADVKDIPEIIKEVTVTKYMNNGNTEVWDTITTIGKIKEWKRATKITDVVEVQETHTQTTAVVGKENDDSFTQKTEVIPVEVKPTYLNLVGGVSYTDKVFYPVGLGVTWKGLQLDITKNVKAPGGNATLSIPLVKLKE